MRPAAHPDLEDRPALFATRADRLATAAVVVGFGVSRLAYALAGVRFDTSLLVYSTNLLDPRFLRHELVQSLWYLHAEPPGFNLIVGLALKLSPFGDGGTFQAVYLALGLVLAVALYDLARQLRLGRTAAVIVAVALVSTPEVILFENEINHDYVAMVLVVLVADALARWARDGRFRAFAAVVVLATTATLVRSLLHPLWLVAVIAFALLVRRPPRVSWRHVAVVVVPLALVGGVMVKNQVLFGSPQLSSFFGFNLWRVTVGSLPAHEQASLRARGIIRTPPTIDSCHLDHPHVPALAEHLKSAGPGRPTTLNSNWECLVGYWRGLEHDAIRAARAEPTWALRGVGGSFELWAAPASIFPLPNRSAISGWSSLYRHVVLLDTAWNPPISPGPVGRFITTGSPDHRYHVSATIILTTLVAIGAGVVEIARRRRGAPWIPARVAMVYASGTIAFVTFVSTFFEHGENNRLRVIVEPLTFLVTVVVVTEVVRTWRAARAPGGRTRLRTVAREA